MKLRKLFIFSLMSLLVSGAYAQDNDKGIAEHKKTPQTTTYKNVCDKCEAKQGKKMPGSDSSGSKSKKSTAK